MKIALGIILGVVLFISVVFNFALYHQRDAWASSRRSERNGETDLLDKERAVARDRSKSIAHMEKTLEGMRNWTATADGYLSEKKIEKELRARQAELDLLQFEAGGE
ncbi:MAG: hypothetical protein EOP88_20460 [Verrucomicrobiaceae bacterium]|nr:MAG: hypothetical protein EOP88_20460 [Verrucomicrobiaceae bacterium]